MKNAEISSFNPLVSGCMLCVPLTFYQNLSKFFLFAFMTFEKKVLKLHL